MATEPTVQHRERSLGQLVAQASQDMTEIVRAEVALAKAEIKDDVKHGAMAGGLFGAAVYIVVLATILLSIAAGYGIVAIGLAPGWAFLILGCPLSPPRRGARPGRQVAGIPHGPAGAGDPLGQGDDRGGQARLARAVTADPAEILLEGPWRHRFVAANGRPFPCRRGRSRPASRLLHGFPSSGGRGDTRSRLWPRPATGWRRWICAAAAPATSPRWLRHRDPDRGRRRRRSVAWARSRPSSSGTTGAPGWPGRCPPWSRV